MAPASQPFRDLYALLRVPPTASTADIQSAFRKASLLHHPDKLPDEQKAEGHVRFVALGDARDTLIDAQKRQQYDKLWQEHQASQKQSAKRKRRKWQLSSAEEKAERQQKKEAARRKQEKWEAMKAAWAAKTEEEKKAAYQPKPQPASTSYASMPQMQQTPGVAAMPHYHPAPHGTPVPNYGYNPYTTQPTRVAYVPQYAPPPPQFPAYPTAGYAPQAPQYAFPPGYQPNYTSPTTYGTYTHENIYYVPNNNVPSFTQPQNYTAHQAAPAQAGPSPALSSQASQKNWQRVDKSTQVKERTWQWVNENSRFEPNGP